MALTKQDLSQVKEVVEEVVEKAVSNVVGRMLQVVVFPEVERIVDEKTKLLPTRKEFLDSMSELMGEVKDERDENIIIDGQV